MTQSLQEQIDELDRQHREVRDASNARQNAAHAVLEAWRQELAAALATVTIAVPQSFETGKLPDYAKLWARAEALKVACEEAEGHYTELERNEATAGQPLMDRRSMLATLLARIEEGRREVKSGDFLYLERTKALLSDSAQGGAVEFRRTVEHLRNIGALRVIGPWRSSLFAAPSPWVDDVIAELAQRRGDELAQDARAQGVSERDIRKLVTQRLAAELAV